MLPSSDSRSQKGEIKKSTTISSSRFTWTELDSKSVRHDTSLALSFSCSTGALESSIAFFDLPACIARRREVDGAMHPTCPHADPRLAGRPRRDFATRSRHPQQSKDVRVDLRIGITTSGWAALPLLLALKLSYSV